MCGDEAFVDNCTSVATVMSASGRPANVCQCVLSELLLTCVRRCKFLHLVRHLSASIGGPVLFAVGTWCLHYTAIMWQVGILSNH